MFPSNEMTLIPARMINEYVYCPRLFWLEYVEREFAESHDTVDGERVHRRVDRPKGALPDSDAAITHRRATSVELASEALGVVAKIDVLEVGNGEVTPIDYKRGKKPSVADGAYDPERVQVALQVLLLREHGYASRYGRLYFAGSKDHVAIEVDNELEAQARAAAQDAHRMAARTTIPDPLLNSPKCGRCSLHAICLPDETNRVKQREVTEIRPFVAAMADESVVYVAEPGARVGVSGETITVRSEAGVLAEVPLLDLGNVSLFGNVQISTQALRAVVARNVPVMFLSFGGWLSAVARSPADQSLDLRIAQHEIIATDDDRALAIARAIVEGKIRNQRTMVRRLRGGNAAGTLRAMSLLVDRTQKARDRDTLLGLEGAAARLYFEAFGDMLTVGTGFEVTGRNRRPPTDPVNAMLSFGYAMLVRETVAAALDVGLEPGLGVYHRVRAGRPAMALDLMEEFRPLVVDSTVLTLVNTREIKAAHFDRRGSVIVLTDEGRRVFIKAIERRLRSNIRHPVFGYDVSYRRAIRIQARLLARTIQGDIASYPAFATR